MVSQQAAALKHLVGRTTSPAVAALCEYLIHQHYTNGTLQQSSFPRNCLELGSSTSDDGILGLFAATLFQIPVTVTTLQPSSGSSSLALYLEASSDRSNNDIIDQSSQTISPQNSDMISRIQRNIDHHRHLLPDPNHIPTVTELDWDDSQQLHRLAASVSTSTSLQEEEKPGFDCILVASNVTRVSLLHQPLADAIAALLARPSSNDNTNNWNDAPATVVPKCFVAHSERGANNLRGYDYQMAELERALLRAGLCTVHVSHHYHHTTAPDTVITTRRNRHHKQQQTSSQKVGILEIVHHHNSTGSGFTTGGSGTALWRAP